VLASLEELILRKLVDAGRVLGDGQDHLDQLVGVAIAVGNAVPDLVPHALHPATQRDAPVHGVFSLEASVFRILAIFGVDPDPGIYGSD
jgi:hypothetical protein